MRLIHMCTIPKRYVTDLTNCQSSFCFSGVRTNFGTIRKYRGFSFEEQHLSTPPTVTRNLMSPNNMSEKKTFNTFVDTCKWIFEAVLILVFCKQDAQLPAALSLSPLYSLSIDELSALKSIQSFWASFWEKQSQSFMMSASKMWIFSGSFPPPVTMTIWDLRTEHWWTPFNIFWHLRPQN